jgi:hypothetical protein
MIFENKDSLKEVFDSDQMQKKKQEKEEEKQSVLPEKALLEL